MNLLSHSFLVLLVAAASCSKSSKDESGSSQTAANETAAAPGNDVPAPAEKECIQPGTYTMTSEGPFYLLDEANELPPPAERKEKTDDIQDCGMHATLNETFTVAMTDGKPTVTFSEKSLGDFKVSGVQATECRLSFSVVNQGEPWVLDRAQIDLDFSGNKVEGQAQNLFFQIKLDGEAGENMVACGTDATKLSVTPVQ